MEKYQFFGFMVEVDQANTRRWYAAAEEWGCACGDCSNFLALARKRQSPLMNLLLMI